MPTRYLVLAHGPDQKKLSLALSSALYFAKELSTKLTILVPTLRHAPSTILRHELGEKATVKLANGNIIRSSGVPIIMRSMKTVNEWEEDGVVVALWGGEKMLEKVDSCNLAQVIVVLSWMKNDVQHWQEQHLPNVLEAQGDQS